MKWRLMLDPVQPCEFENGGHFGKYHNTLCLFPPNFCMSIVFSFSWDFTMGLREIKDNAYAKLRGGGGGRNKEYYGIF